MHLGRIWRNSIGTLDKQWWSLRSVAYTGVEIHFQKYHSGFSDPKETRHKLHCDTSGYLCLYNNVLTSLLMRRCIKAIHVSADMKYGETFYRRHVSLNTSCSEVSVFRDHSKVNNTVNISSDLQRQLKWIPKLFLDRAKWLCQRERDRFVSG